MTTPHDAHEPERIDPTSKLGTVTRRAVLGGGAAGIAAAMLDACGGTQKPVATATAANTTTGSTVFGQVANLQFTLVSDATSDPFSVAVQYGAQDACTLLGCNYQWTGSDTANLSQMVAAINQAILQKSNGIATALIGSSTLNTPVADALGAGIPVIAFGSDAPGNPRLVYIGPDLHLTGMVIGRRIADLLGGRRGGDIALFTATPGAPSVRLRVQGIAEALAGHRELHYRVVASGSGATEQQTAVAAFVAAHRSYRGFFALDGGSTVAVGQAIQQYGLGHQGVRGGGVGLDATTQQLISAGALSFALDEQPYLQGFMAILELYLHNVSDGLTGLADVDTGTHVLDRANIGAYNHLTSRFQGNSSGQGVQHS